MEASDELLGNQNRGGLSAGERVMKERMYAPQAFRVEDRERLQAFIAQVGFGLLVSGHSQGASQSSWLPFLLSEDGQSLEGHLARANPQWKGWEKEAFVSVHFLGPHAYISPNAYPAGPSVPTWNYAAARVDGEIEIVHDNALRVEIVARLVEANEASQEPPWQFERDSEFVQGLLKAIVCFRINIRQICGSFKMSQNKEAGSRKRVIRYLKQSGGLLDQACAAFMEGMDADPTWKSGEA